MRIQDHVVTHVSRSAWAGKPLNKALSLSLSLSLPLSLSLMLSLPLLSLSLSHARRKACKREQEISKCHFDASPLAHSTSLTQSCLDMREPQCRVDTHTEPVTHCLFSFHRAWRLLINTADEVTLRYEEESFSKSTQHPSSNQ